MENTKLINVLLILNDVYSLLRETFKFETSMFIIIFLGCNLNALSYYAVK